MTAVVGQKRPAPASNGPELDAYPRAVTEDDVRFNWMKSNNGPKAQRAEAQLVPPTAPDATWERLKAAWRSPNYDPVSSNEFLKPSTTAKEAGSSRVGCIHSNAHLAAVFEAAAERCASRSAPVGGVAVAFLCVGRWSVSKRSSASTSRSEENGCSSFQSCPMLERALGVGTMGLSVIAERTSLPLFIVDVSVVETAHDTLGISSPVLPSLVLLHWQKGRRGDQQVSVSTVSEKHTPLPKDVFSCLVLPPVTDAHHLREACIEAATEMEQESSSGNGKPPLDTYLLVYNGAVWCPPCLRIMPFIESTVQRFLGTEPNPSCKIHCFKADRDGYASFGEVYELELIPSFVLFRITNTTKTSLNGDPGLLPPKVASFQNSDPSVLMEFLKKECVAVSITAMMDEDF